MAKLQPGFSLLELALVITIIGVLSYIVAPNFFRRGPLYERKAFVTMLNTIVRQAWIKSLETGNAHKVLFNLASRTIKLEEKTKETDHNGTSIFKPVFMNNVGQNYVWPEQFEVLHFFVQGVDEVAQHASESTMEDVWFFVVPEGMAQEVIINSMDRKDTYQDSDGKQMSLVLNPFRVQFKAYEEFKSPASF
jgi:prepilin-type N-terminal cleavage/methylation domain-containing protein